MSGIERPPHPGDDAALTPGGDAVTDQEAPAPAPAPAPGAGRSRPRLGRPLGPVPQVGARAFLGLDRVDLAWMAGLLVVALVIRVLSPIFPNVLSNPFGSSPVVAWGLGSPYNAGECNNVPVGSDGKELPETTLGTPPNETAAAPVIKTPDQSHCGFVFDEVYFPVDAAIDLHQPTHDYFDPEPPLTKLLMAPAINFLGFGTWSWRITTAISGSLLVIVAYLIARRLRHDRFFAVAAATVMCFDGLELVESRVGVIDIIAILWVALAVYAFLLHWGARTRTQWRATLYAFAAVLGLAFGAKLTAIAPAALAATLIGARLLEPAVKAALGMRVTEGGARTGEAQMWRDAGGRRALLHYGAAVLVVGLFFVGTYSRYLTIPHTLAAFNSCDPTTGLGIDTSVPTNGATSAGYTLYPNPDISHGGNPLSKVLFFVGDSLRDVRVQVSVSINYHKVECRPHPYASHWYTWPVLAHPVLMSVDSSHTTASGQPETGYITNLGNPVVWWLAIPALLFCVVAMTRGPSVLSRLWPLGMLSLGLTLMIVGFRAGEHEYQNVRVQPNSLFYAGLGLMVVFTVYTVWCGVALRRFVPAFIVLGFLAAWMMWTFGNEQRVLFSYHMLGALPFVALALAYALTALHRSHVRLGTYELPLRPVAYAALGLIVAGFVFFYPIWTGLPLTSADFDARTWWSSWINGWT